MSMQHEFLDDDLRDQAALFVLESMPEQESRAFRLHLRRCDVCRREVDSLSRAARDLAWLAPEETPRPELWDRVLERIRRPEPPDFVGRTGPVRLDLEQAVEDARVGPDRATDPPNSRDPNDGQIWKRWAASGSDGDAFLFLSASECRFEPTSMPGVEARRLFVDPESDRVTMLVRMAPGSSYPAHVHGGPEECLVISGDLRIGALHMKGGDFQHAEAGSTHVVQSTDEGCVLLIVSSLHDEIL